MRPNNFVLLLLTLCIIPVFGQKEISATRINAPLKIDGDISEELWRTSQLAENFTINYPAFGELSKFKSRIYIVYDNNALYLAGELYDPQPDSINDTYSQRDDFGNGDWFAVVIDPYQNGVSAFRFAVTAAGVEIDGLKYPDYEDQSWNAVWKSSTRKTNYGWSFEMRIPYSAIRFPNKSLQSWNINFYRQVRRTREVSSWHPINPEVFGEITQMGVLNGIVDVKSPLRLSFVPYSTGYLENSFNSSTGKQQWGVRGTYGMDLKYGLNDAFTLDMTLIPDFGQTVSDNQVLNLGPFEVRYNENRPFFLEGPDLFSIGGIFYSRRIGGRPYNYHEIALNDSLGETIVSNPSVAPLLNASKFSGRTKSGLGIGVFNAVENRSFAVIEDSLGNRREFETNPLTNYNVFVLSQNLANNGSVSFVNTSVLRSGNNPNANVSSISSNIFSKDKKYKVYSRLNNSGIVGEEVVLGHSFYSSIEKVSGTINYAFSYSEISDKYDPNDLGFLYNNNSRNYSASFGWNDYTPGKFFLRRWADLSIDYLELYKPALFSALSLNGSHVATFRNFLTCGVSGGINPLGTVDHFESRTFGVPLNFKADFNISAFYSSDYSKRFALDMRIRRWQLFNSEMTATGATISPRMRLSDRMFLVWNSSYDFFAADIGYVAVQDESYADKIIIGVRNRKLVENSLQSEFIFTKRMGVELKLRHYWTQVDYLSFRELQNDGTHFLSSYNPLNDDETSVHNTSFNAFTVDINYRWVFMPGSELRVVYKNNLFHGKNELDANYFKTFQDLFQQAQINSISVKFLIYLDVLYFRKKNAAVDSH